MKMDTKIYSAPLQGFTESAWRNAHSQVFGGVEAYYTPFVRLEKGEIRNKDRREVSASHNRVDRLVPQLLASEAGEMESLIQFLLAEGYHEMDLNMGCPFPLLTKRAKGSGILAHPDKVGELLTVMQQHPEVSFSVKMRLGWESSSDWKELLPLLNASCVKQLTLHPRIGKQQYKGTVDWDSFEAFYVACTLPLVYNGDLSSFDSVKQVLLRYPRLKGIMLGRGLLADPSLAAACHSGKEMAQEERYRKVLAMHELMYEQYFQTIEGGDAQLLQKMKTMWEYLLPDLEKKARKAILKSNRLDVYLRAVEAALR